MSLIISSGTGRNSAGIGDAAAHFSYEKRTDYSLRQHLSLYLFQAELVKGADKFRNEEIAKNGAERSISDPVYCQKNDKKLENDFMKPLSPLARSRQFVIYCYADSYGSGSSAVIDILHPLY